MATLGVIGQGAGAAAARSAELGRDPGHFTPDDIEAVQQAILREDAYIPHVASGDPLDLARTAVVSASSEGGLPDANPDERLALASSLAQLVPVSRNTLRAVKVYLKNTTADRVLLSAKLVAAKDVWDVAALDRGDAFATADAELTPHEERWLEFVFDVQVDDAPRLFWFQIDAAPGVEWACSKPTAPGLACAQKHETRWWWAPRMFTLFPTLAVQTDPEAEPYAAGNVVSGVARPEQWANLWTSSPDEPLPQWVDLTLPEPAEVAEVHIAFDTNVSRTPFLMKPGQFRSPECAKDYSLLVETDAGFEKIVEAKDNYLRRRKHRFAPVTTRRVRLQIDATNGVPEARVYEVRLYGP